MVKIKTTLWNYLHDNFWLLIVSFIFGTILSQGAYIGDDIVIFNNLVHTLPERIQEIINYYNNWGSRIIISFVDWYFKLLGHWGLFLYASICMYTLIKAFMMLTNNSTLIWCIGIILLFPFGILSTAGWGTTSYAYLGPMCFAILSLVPIKKCYYQETFSRLEIIGYSLALIYAANLEQGCGMLLITYSVACIYFLVQKKMETCFGYTTGTRNYKFYFYHDMSW